MMLLDPKYSSIPPPRNGPLPGGSFHLTAAPLLHLHFMDDIAACGDVPDRTCTVRPAGTCAGRHMYRPVQRLLGCLDYRRAPLAYRRSHALGDALACEPDLLVQ
jgi:hypothetical protein